MKYFKTIALILSVFIFSTSCNQRDNFNSLGGEENQQFLGSGNAEHEEAIKNLVNQRQIVKIGNKKSKNSVNLSETVGQNNLKNNETTRSVATNEKEVVTIEVEVEESKEGIELTKNLSLLFYIDSKRSHCLRQFRKNNKAFLNYLNKAPHWEMAFSFHRDNKELIKLTRTRGYVLSKDYKKPFLGSDAHHIFAATINGYPHSNLDGFELKKLIQSPYHINPLKGLGYALETFSDNKEGQKVVLYFDDDFPYYSSKEWKSFYEKHKNLTILVISRREANISNLSTAFNANVDIAPVMGCTLSSPKIVSDTLKHILVRLK